MTTPRPKHSNNDVRMRGFAERTTVEDALAWLDSVFPRLVELATEGVEVGNAAGRVLAKDISSSVDVPSFARAMMDGFAVRGEDTYGVSPYNRLPLMIVGTCLPGHAFPGPVAAGEAVRIMTGAPLPAGADAVLPVELTELAGADVLVLDQVSAGKHVGQRGEDLHAGALATPAGRWLRPQDVGLLSSLGCGWISVVRRPSVRILIAGNEILPAGTPPEGARIADANGPMLAALTACDGGQLLSSEIVPDDPDPILAALAQPADVILVSGGSSVGSGRLCTYAACGAWRTGGAWRGNALQQSDWLGPLSTTALGRSAVAFGGPCGGPAGATACAIADRTDRAGAVVLGPHAK